MKTLFNFGFKNTKTFFILPLLILNVMRRSFEFTLNELNQTFKFQVSELVKGIRSSITFVGAKVRKAIK